MAEQKQETVDFAYVIDCTGSMSSYIQQTQKDIHSIVELMNRTFPQFKLRLGCVAYRDWCDDKRLEYQGFTENVNSFTNYVGTLKAAGGGDEAEDVLGGLNRAAELGWNSNLRVLFHICDAPPHNKMYHAGAGDDFPDGHPSDPTNYHQVVLKKLRAKNIHLCIAKLRSSCDKMIRVFEGYAKEIGLTLEERNINDTSELLNAVQQTLTILTKMRQEIKETGDEMSRITHSMSALKYESEVFVNETITKMNIMERDIEGVTTKLKDVEDIVSDTKREYQALKTQHGLVMAYARNISGSDSAGIFDVEEAEEKVIKLSEDLCGITEKYSAAQDKVNQALDDLTEKNKALHATEKKVEKKIKEKTKMKKQISNLIGKIKSMDKSENRDKLRSEIKNKLKEVRKIFLSDMKMKNKIRDIKKAILAAFTDADKRQRDIDACKTDVESKLNELDTVLDELDDKL